jgi:hypothetical protein
MISGIKVTGENGISSKTYQCSKEITMPSREDKGVFNAVRHVLMSKIQTSPSKQLCELR